MKRWKTWLGNGILGISALGVSIGIAEAAVRIVAPRSTSIAHQDPYGLAMHYPGITRYLPEHSQLVSINSAGMRDREHELEKPDGTFRVLVLGDSFMEAVQVPFEASMPALLEKTLSQQTGRTVEVVNAGVSGWGTDDSLRYLTEYGFEYDPDLVLVAMTLHNDVSDNLREYWHTARDGSLVDQQRPPIPWFTYKTLELKAFLSVRLQLVQLWRRVRKRQEIQDVTHDLRSHVVQLFYEPTPERIEFGFELTGLLLDRIQDVSTTHGASVALVLLPLEYQLTDEIFADFVEEASLDPAAMSIDKPQRLMTQISSDLELPLIDLTHAFRQWTADRDDPLYVSWDGHWNEAGHELATGVVTQALVESGMIGQVGAAR